MDGRLADNIVHFARVLRKAGLRIGPAAVTDAIEAVQGAASPRITISVETRGKTVVIRVADNGPGLSDAVRDRLFTPFTTDKPDGMGLGLVISRDIVASFGGELSHEPSASGAVFIIRLAKAG